MNNYITPPETYSTTSQNSLSPEDNGTSTKNFQFVNDCSLELHASPFIVSGFMLRILNSSVIGFGSVVPLLTLPVTDGKIYYNDAKELSDSADIRYKIFMYIDPSDNMLRIDFNRNYSEFFPNDDFGNVDAAKFFPSHRNADIQKVAQNLTQTSDFPDIVFKGVIPSDYPQQFDPLFGIFKFETTADGSQSGSPRSMADMSSDSVDTPTGNAADE